MNMEYLKLCNQLEALIDQQKALEELGLPHNTIDSMIRQIVESFKLQGAA